jgi:hypothetical protein
MFWIIDFSTLKVQKKKAKSKFFQFAVGISQLAVNFPFPIIVK